MHGNVREHLAVDFNAGLHQAVDDAAVRQPVQACRRIDAGDPQCAELALVGAAVAEGILARLDDRLLGGAIGLAACVVVALRLLQYFLVTGAWPSRHA